MPVGGHCSVEELEQRLAHLKWQKSQNRHQIQGMMQRSKQLQQRDTLIEMSNDRGTQRAMWVKSVVLDEMTKPIEVSRTYVSELEERDLNQQKQRKIESRRHQRMVQRAKDTIQSHERHRQRMDVFRDEKRQLESSKSMRNFIIDKEMKNYEEKE